MCESVFLSKKTVNEKETRETKTDQSLRKHNLHTYSDVHQHYEVALVE